MFNRTTNDGVTEDAPLNLKGRTMADKKETEKTRQPKTAQDRFADMLASIRMAAKASFSENDRATAIYLSEIADALQNDKQLPVKQETK